MDADLFKPDMRTAMNAGRKNRTMLVSDFSSNVLRWCVETRVYTDSIRNELRYSRAQINRRMRQLAQAAG